MTAATTEKKSTKDLILDAAFSFCNEPRYNSFSLSELAAKVGITKTAIYRHFKDKDDVHIAMYERFCDELASCLRAVRNECKNNTLPVESVTNLITFFCEHIYYVNYMFGSLATVQDFEWKLSQDLEKRGITNTSKGFQFEDDGTSRIVIKDFDEYVRSLYCAVTVYIFIKGREKIQAAGGQVDEAPLFARKLVHFLTHGLAGSVGKENQLYPTPLTAERQAELEAICTIQPDALPEENRFFTAFAAVIKKYKMSGVTVERVASELGMAKSSLYEYFDNKNAMLKTLVMKELQLLNLISLENIAEAHNLTEYIFIVMHTECAFFSLRPSIIPVLSWILMSTMDETFFDDDDASGDAWLSRSGNALQELNIGLQIPPRKFIGWISSLPATLAMQCNGHALGKEEMQKALKQMFSFLENGIEQ
ncbi:MAG: TetR/AcrR family transcriptional regulator [Treponema sp.]|nr:TetR/AcrR family transcriptional regulator [Treponema sp.]